MSTFHEALDIAGLETVYDALANAIDKAGTDKAQVFHVKLALLCADAPRFQRQIQSALDNL